MKEGKFRKDLYFRLNVLKLEIPPLRERIEDVPSLAEHFLARCERKTGRTMRLSDEALGKLQEYAWPGNAPSGFGIIVQAWITDVRELGTR